MGCVDNADRGVFHVPGGLCRGLQGVFYCIILPRVMFPLAGGDARRAVPCLLYSEETEQEAVFNPASADFSCRKPR